MPQLPKRILVADGDCGKLHGCVVVNLDVDCHRSAQKVLHAVQKLHEEHDRSEQQQKQPEQPVTDVRIFHKDVPVLWITIVYRRDVGHLYKMDKDRKIEYENSTINIQSPVWVFLARLKLQLIFAVI